VGNFQLPALKEASLVCLGIRVLEFGPDTFYAYLGEFV
jgi:hypothetical protein